MSNKIKTYRDIQGWFDFENLYSSIVDLCSQEKETRFLEVGTWLGRSTCFLAGLAKAWSKPFTIYAVDTFKGEETCQFQKEAVAANNGSIKKLFIKHVKDLGLKDYIIPIESKSTECLKFIPKGTKFHVVFIDADHSYEAVKNDLNYLWDVVQENGIICGHDYQLDVKRAVDEFAIEKNSQVQKYSTCWIINKLKK